MYDTLFAYIRKRSTTPLAETEIEIIKEVCVPRKLRKRKYFVQEGEVCKYGAFILKGAMREFYIDDKGVEHITRLFIEDTWVSERESYIMRTPAKHYIEAWEDCEVLQITRDDFVNRTLPIPAVAEMIRVKDEEFAIAVQKRLASLNLPTKERYAELLKCSPELIQRFPQHFIASYLSVTKETLSRIRGLIIKS